MPKAHAAARVRRSWRTPDALWAQIAPLLPQEIAAGPGASLRQLVIVRPVPPRRVPVCGTPAATGT
jgi:hypothetical protein